MSNGLQIVYLARHGETAWSLSGQHTGLTDLPLTERGECNARRLGERLNGLEFAQVFSSPLRRVRRTCELAGFGPRATVDADLVEWNYGDYEGLRTTDIRARRPDWQMFRDGFPRGESFAEIAARAGASSGASDPSTAPYSSSPAGTSFEFWPHAGWESSPRTPATCC